jgi:hypothetical protein
MTDFRDMAEKAKAAFDEKRATEDRAAEAAREEHSRRTDTSIQKLNAVVRPILEKAKAAFRDTGVDSQITTNFDEIQYHGNPSIIFRCVGPKRSSDDWRLEGPPAFFTAVGDSIEVGLGKNSFDRSPVEKLGSFKETANTELINKAIKHALDAYYAQMEKYRS